LSSFNVTGSKIGAVNHFMLTYEHVRQKNLNLKGFLVNQNVSDGYELTNLKQQIFDLTGRKVFGAIPYNLSFTIESYVENFPYFVDISNLGLEYI